MVNTALDKASIMEKCAKAEQQSAMKCLNNQLEYIKKNGIPGGLCSDLAEVKGASESMLISVERRHEGEVEIKIPFAGAKFCVHLLFYLKEPWVSPELIFSDRQFMSLLTAKDLAEYVPALDSWSCTDMDMIVQLLHQILQLYKRHQLEQLVNNDVMNYQYQGLLKTLSIGEGDIEVIVSNTGSNPSSLMVRLPVSLQDVPPVLINANSGQTSCLLEVVFQSTGGFIPKLHLSPCVEHLIGGSKSISLPKVPPGTCLVDYVERVLELLEQRVRRLLLSFESRKQFVAQVLCQFGRAVIEYDAEKFSKIVLMSEVSDFHFLIFITLDAFFPQEAPEVILQSLYHTEANFPITMTVKSTYFSSQWTPEEMVSKLKEEILSRGNSFRLCDRNSS